MRENIILIVDEMHFIQNAVKKRIQKELPFEVVTASSKAEALTIANRIQDDIFVAVLNLELTDDQDRSIVDDFAQRNIPQIVFSGKFDELIRNQLLNKAVIDYIPQEGSNSINYLLSLIHRLLANQHISALVVDDSKAAQTFFAKMLKKIMIPCTTVGSPNQALDLLIQEPDKFSLLLIDYAMPEMNGVELILALQKHINISHKAIIGVSGEQNHALTAHFLKAGASDFLYKSSSYEEFTCRISQSLNRLDQVSQLTAAASTDFLTKLKNRRALFDLGSIFWQLTQREKRNDLSICMLDIDNFKYINDTYGHDTGDLILRNIAEILTDNFRKSDLVVRYGGEEFCILLQKSTSATAFQVMEKLRKRIASYQFLALDKSIRVTVSIGICSDISSSLEAMINTADKHLYMAKEQGRNQVIVSDTP